MLLCALVHFVDLEGVCVVLIGIIAWLCVLKLVEEAG